MNDTIDASPEAALGRAIGANVLACELIGVLLSIGQNDLVDQAVRQATALSGSSYSGGENLDADKIGEFARVHIMTLSAAARMKAAIDVRLTTKS